jgi:hypothetical protein
MTDGERRFLKEIADRIPPTEVVDAYLFPAFRHGVVETGVAVLATSTDAPSGRYAVVTARYRSAIKGMERGAWDFAVRREADAPLDALAEVVYGVARRAADYGAAATHMSGDAFRELLSTAS